MHHGADGTARFYDDLAATYDRLYPDWDRACTEQGLALHGLLTTTLGPGPHQVLDAAVGIGTQLIGLAGHGHRMTGTDLSPAAVRRARAECAARGVAAELGVADLRALPFDGAAFDAAVVADNALAHLRDADDLVAALRELRRVVRPGGAVLATLRDYAQARAEGLPGTMPQVSRRPDGDMVAFQVWDWHPDGQRYDLEHFQLDGRDGSWTAVARHATLWALTRAEVLAAAREAGLEAQWLEPAESGFFQPLVLARVSG